MENLKLYDHTAVKEHPQPKSLMTALPESQGVLSFKVNQVLRTLESQRVKSLVLVRNGSLIAEGYYHDTDQDTQHSVYSVTKSIVSALAGIAISEGKLQLNQKLSAFFPEVRKDPIKSRITVKDIISMQSGLEWDNKEERASEDMIRSSDWIGSILEHPAAHKPGTKFNYSNGDAHLLSVMLQKALKQPLSEYADEKLFKPLGITDWKWATDPQAYTIGCWGLALTTRDMAKLGELFLNGGQWEGKGLISRQWFKESLTARSNLRFADGSQGGYGYYWWMKTIGGHPVFYAGGSFGQRIFVVPKLNMVVAMTAHTSDIDMPEKVLKQIMRCVIPELQFNFAVNGRTS